MKAFKTKTELAEFVEEHKITDFVVVLAAKGKKDYFIEKIKEVADPPYRQIIGAGRTTCQYPIGHEAWAKYLKLDGEGNAVPG